MKVLSVIAGLLIVSGVAADMGLKVLHPTIRGAFSHRLTRTLWRLIRGLATVTKSRRVLTFAG
jgi:hypothetical protein